MSIHPKTSCFNTNICRVTDSQKKEGTGRGKRKWILPAVLIGIAVVICVLLRSCRARDEPFLIDTPERIYEENVTVENIYDVILTIKGDAGIGLYNCCFESKL